MQLVEEQRTVVRLLYHAFVVPNRAAKRTAPVPEQVSEGQLVRDLAQVQRDELSRSACATMNIPSESAFADAGLAKEHYRQAPARDFVREVVDQGT
jgi:hypothetical protein